MTRTALLALPLLALGVSTAEAQPRKPRLAAPALKKGDKGDSVRILQHYLAEARRQQGITSPKVEIDADYGNKTVGFVKAFQRAAGLPATGSTDARTWLALRTVAARGPLGRIDPLTRPTSDTYARANKGPSDVKIHPQPAIEVVKGKRAQPLVFESKFAVDADGDGDAYKSDPWGQPTTSLTYRGTRKSLDPTKIPYFVLPIGFDKRHPPHLKLGDIAAVIHNGKVAYAIYGDRGPKTKIGEGSILLAKQLGINPDPKSGGFSTGGVFWVVFPGSGTGQPLTPAEIKRRGEALLLKAGGRPAKPATTRRRRSRRTAMNEGRRGIIHGLER